MAGPLLDRLERRVTFVVGKGGVGKSTTAAGLALALADGGVATHLLSTDPAHSLSDILDEEPGRGPRPSRCTDLLTVEELDAAALAAARLGSLAPALTDLIDRGTYLDVADAASLLDAALPGLDEIGAALRIAALAAAGARLVVDTAPTGHTLRMLDVPATVRGWVRVFEAMADKADTVAAALVGRPVSGEALAGLGALQEEVERFARATREADFVVVAAPGAVVAAETGRLMDTLEARGLGVAATVAPAWPRVAEVEGRAEVARAAEVVADVRLPFEVGVRGCEGIRRWWSRPWPGVPGPPAAERRIRGRGPAPRPAARGRGRDRVPRELDRGLVVFAGKGGVGKTTCAAAAAVELAGSGPVVLMGVDPAGSLRDVLPVAPEGVDVRELDAEAELRRLKRLYQAEVEAAFESVGLDRAARLDRAVVESLWELAPPGIDEVMAIGRLADETPAGARLVLDTAPTGHFLRLLAMPELALDWTRRLMRILLKSGAPGELDAPAEHLLRFARRFRGLRERLADPTRTAIVLVTLDEAVPRAETGRLAGRLESLGLAPAAVIVNRATGPVSPPLPLPTLVAPAVPEPVGAPALAAFLRSWDRTP